MSTNKLSAKNIKREWHLIDAKDKVLGRLATEVATILMGKKKPEYVPYLDTGDFVVVTNAAKVKLTGKKMQTKEYKRHSGYPGGLKVETFDKIIERKPEFVIEHAVAGMLPRTKLGREMIKKLKVFAGEDHTFQKQVKIS
ncbi:50S ribosomal protein L13 [Candidatus Daviesbacteria bacterium]|nr:50S ribosomal protein L13 [Candidatus Daviesbacteria bacterium]